MIKNKNGYTLIELIVAFAILATATTMTIVAVFNIVNLFTESSLIKTNTNELFNTVSSRVGEEIVSYSENISFNDGTLNIPCSTISEENDQVAKIKLSYFRPKYMASMLPEEVIESPKPVEGLEADFFGLMNFTKVPTNHDVETIFEYIPNGYYRNLESKVLNALDKNIGIGTIKNDVGGFVLTHPQDESIKKFAQSLDSSYQNMLGDSYKLRYFKVENHGGTWQPYVFCYLIPKQKGIYLSYNNGNSAKWIEIKNGKIDKNTLNDVIGSRFHVYDDAYKPGASTYTKDQIINLQFYKDFPTDETFYCFRVD